MFNFTQEQLEAARAAKSPEELIEMAKEAGVELTREQAEGFLSPPIGELADEELENVSGGGCGSKPDWMIWDEKALKHFGAINNTNSICSNCRASSKGRYSVYESTNGRESITGEVLTKDTKCFNCGKEGTIIYR